MKPATGSLTVDLILARAAHGTAGSWYRTLLAIRELPEV